MEVHHHRAGRLQTLLKNAFHLFGLCSPQPFDPIGLGQLHEVGRLGHVGLGVAAAVEELLPLADHPEVKIVQDHHFDGQAVMGDGAQLLDVHLDAAVSRHIDHGPVRAGHLRADGGGQPEPHRPQSSRGKEGVRLVKRVKLGRPHLVLAHLGRDDRPAPRELMELFNDVLGFDVLVAAVAEGHFRFPLTELVAPGADLPLGRRQPLFVAETMEGLERRGAVADDGQIGPDDSVDRDGIDIDVDDPGMGGKGRDLGGSAIIEPDADRHQKIALADGHVGRVGAMHAQHAGPERIARGEGAQPHQRRDDRDPELFHEGAENLGGFSENHPSPDDDERFFRLEKHFQGFIAEPLQIRTALLRGRNGGSGGLRFRDRLNHILREIDKDRSRSPRTGNLKGLPDRPVQIADVPDQKVVFRAGPGDPGDVHLLEAVTADQGRGNLPRQDDDGNGIHIGVCNPGHRVGGAGSRRDQADADTTGDPGVTVGGMDGPLFVPHQDVPDLLPEQLVIDVHDASSRITEEGIDVLFLQGRKKDLRSGLLHGFSPSNLFFPKKKPLPGDGNGLQFNLFQEQTITQSLCGRE